MSPTTWTPRTKIIRGLGTEEPPPSFVLGTTEPTLENTGLLDGWTEAMLGNFTGPEIFTNSGTTIQNVRVPFWMDVRGTDITFRNCLIVGSGVPTSGKALIRSDNTNNRRIKVERCVLRPEPSYSNNLANAFQGHNLEISRCTIQHVVDFMQFRNPTDNDNALNLKIYGNYGDNHTWHPDSGQSDGQTHNDGIQIQGGNITGSEIIGNALWGKEYSVRSSSGAPDRGTGNVHNGRYAQGALAGIQMTNLGGYPAGSLLISKNWIYGYERGINAGSAVSVNEGQWTENRFDDAQGERASGSLAAGTGYTITMDPSTTVNTGDGTALQNVYMATPTGIAAGTPITVRRNQ